MTIDMTIWRKNDVDGRHDGEKVTGENDAFIMRGMCSQSATDLPPSLQESCKL